MNQFLNRPELKLAAIVLILMALIPALNSVTDAWFREFPALRGAFKVGGWILFAALLIKAVLGESNTRKT